MLGVLGSRHMPAVLGIDAAWTLTQPSGVALATETYSGWSLIATASSYQRFYALADRRLTGEQRPPGCGHFVHALGTDAAFDALRHRQLDDELKMAPHRRFHR